MCFKPTVDSPPFYISYINQTNSNFVSLGLDDCDPLVFSSRIIILKIV